MAAQSMLVFSVLVQLCFIKIIDVHSRLIKMMIIYISSTRVFLIDSGTIQMISSAAKHIQVVLVCIYQIQHVGIRDFSLLSIAHISSIIRTLSFTEWLIYKIMFYLRKKIRMEFTRYNVLEVF